MVATNPVASIVISVDEAVATPGPALSAVRVEAITLSGNAEQVKEEIVRLRSLAEQTFRSKYSRYQRFPISIQNRCSSPRKSRRPSATAGEAMIRSRIGFSLKTSNLSSTRTAKTTPSSRAA